MKYINIVKPGGPEQLKLTEGPVPKPKAGEVLIKVAAAGVNRPDVLQRMGTYPPPRGASPILGLEVSGTIETLGPDVSSQWSIGDKVCALVPGGGYAEYCTTPAVQCLPLPQNLTMIQAAGIPETFFTVWTNVFQRGHLKAGESILIHGGAGGIGTTAIQLAKLFGAQVFVTAGSDPKCAECIKLGADHAINYKKSDFAEDILKHTSNQGVDIILDIVGGSYVEKNLKCLSVEGRLVQISFLEGSKVELDLRTIMTKRLTLTGSTLRPLPIEKKQLIAEELFDQVWPLMESGRITPIIHKTFSLAEASKAHALMESSTHIGKIILTL